MKTVFLFVPHYVYSSDLLHTNYIRYLAQKYKVVVFSPIFKLEGAEHYFQSANVIYIPWDIEFPRLWLLFNKTLRIALVREFDNLKYHQLRAKTEKNLNWQRKFLRAAGRFLPAPLVSVDFLTKIEKLLLPHSARLQKYADEYKPSIILTATPGFNAVEAEAILFGKKKGIKTAAVNFNWDNLFNNAKQIRKPDYLIVWTYDMERAALEIHHYPKNRVFVCGVLRFDDHFTAEGKLRSVNPTERETFLREKNLDPSLKTVFFTTVPPQTYPLQIEFLESLIALRDKNVFGQDLNIFVRLHPRDEIALYQKFFGIKNVHIEMAGKLKRQWKDEHHKVEMDKTDLDNLRKSLLYADMAVNFRSSISLETCLYNIPTINLAYKGYALQYEMDHYIPLLESGAVRLVENDEQFIKVMNMYLKDQKLDSEKRAVIAKEYVPFQDGLSYKRNVDFTKEIIENEK